MVNRTLYWVKIDHLDSVVCIVQFCFLVFSRTHTQTHTMRQYKDDTESSSERRLIRTHDITTFVHIVKNNWIQERQRDGVKCCLPSSVFRSHSMENQAPTNPFIANYQIYRLPLKTIKILSSYLRSVLNWTLAFTLLPAPSVAALLSVSISLFRLTKPFT